MNYTEQVLEKLENIEKLLESRLPAVEEPHPFDELVKAIKIVMTRADSLELTYNYPSQLEDVLGDYVTFSYNDKLVIKNKKSYEE